MLQTTTTIGRNGEQLAHDFLESKGYTILCHNFRCGKKEIDIIAQHENCVLFVEVKMRKNIRFGYPEQSVTPAKQKKIRHVAEYYLHEKEWKGNIRFDIIAITKLTTGTEIMHLEDAF